ncbi:MAG: NAD-dependent epimerase/dehydratase family protein [Candidatus Aminicenantes bacterium]|nr:NAD-dependent epimerase/dehydratase family protein [Candidatus Aminicenantes bacterium]
MTAKTPRILITGAAGQIGSELTPLLRQKYGAENVVASDIKTDISSNLLESGPYETLDVTDKKRIQEVIQIQHIDFIFHMSAILSAAGEDRPQLAWDVNMNGTHNILEAARLMKIEKVFVPSSIAVFGPGTPSNDTPQETVLRPQTMYGVTKVAGELLCDYYVQRYGLDVRGCRYPGIISYQTLPGGGTTDYAVAIFYDAVEHSRYLCFLSEDTMLPMMYMPDCLKATIKLMEADFSRLKHHSDFNIAGMSFTAGELAAEIKKHLPEFQIEYKPDYRQQIAESWPKSIDDTAARTEWDWQPDYDLPAMTKDMLKVLQERQAHTNLD